MIMSNIARTLLFLLSALALTALLCLRLDASAQELPARTVPRPGPDSTLATEPAGKRPAPEVATAALAKLRTPDPRQGTRNPAEVDHYLTQVAYRLQLVLGDPLKTGGRKPPVEVACEYRAGGISDKERNAWTEAQLAAQPCCYRSSGTVWCAQRQVSPQHQSYLAWSALYAPQRLPPQAEPPMPEATQAEVEAQVVERTRAQRDALATCALHQAAAQASGAGVTPDCRAEAEAWDLARQDAEAAVLSRVRLVADDAPAVEGCAK
jgi:hypothetical protein